MEWFYDSGTAQLYYVHNATGMPPDSLEFEAVTTKGQTAFYMSMTFSVYLSMQIFFEGGVSTVFHMCVYNRACPQSC